MGQQSGELDSQGVLIHQNPVETKTEEQKLQEKQDEQMRMNINILLANAKAESDPKQMAEMIVSKLSEEQIDQFYDFISADDFLERLILLVPEVEAHKNWFIALRDQVMELLTEPADESTFAESETVAGESDGSDISDTSDSDTGADT
jgi:hypothetical protein